MKKNPEFSVSTLTVELKLGAGIVGPFKEKAGELL